MIHLLGTGAAFSSPERTTTMLAFSEGGKTLVVDCGGDVIQRLLAAGIDLASISGLIVTHEHADHVGGFALFMEKIWLFGRREPLPVYGIAPAISQARRLFETFDTSGWEGLPEIQWREIEHRDRASVLDDGVWRISASPVQHSVPCVGLRVENRRTGKVAAYSCDTEPLQAVAELARGADVLIHEATGEGKGHSSASQAAEIAASAGAKQLVLVHLPPQPDEGDLRRARERFAETRLGVELERIVP